MAFTEPFQDSASIGTTEYFLAADSTTQGSGQATPGGYALALDLSNLANGDVFRVRVYDAVAAAGAALIFMEWTISYAQSEPGYLTPYLPLYHKWDFSLTKLAGTDRTITWSIRKAG